MRRRQILAAALAAALSACASGGGAGDAGDAGDATTFELGVPEAGPDRAVSCTALAPAAPVTATNTTDPPPALGGGALADGAYRLTGVAFYMNAGASVAGQFQGAGAVGGGMMQLLLQSDRGFMIQESYSYTASGANLSLQRVCPSTASQMIAYATNAGTLQFQLPGPGVFTFTR